MSFGPPRLSSVAPRRSCSKTRTSNDFKDSHLYGRQRFNSVTFESRDDDSVSDIDPYITKKTHKINKSLTQTIPKGILKYGFPQEIYSLRKPHMTTHEAFASSALPRSLSASKLQSKLSHSSYFTLTSDEKINSTRGSCTSFRTRHKGSAQHKENLSLDLSECRKHAAIFFLRERAGNVENGCGGCVGRADMDAIMRIFWPKQHVSTEDKDELWFELQMEQRHSGSCKEKKSNEITPYITDPVVFATVIMRRASQIGGFANLAEFFKEHEDAGFRSEKEDCYSHVRHGTSELSTVPRQKEGSEMNSKICTVVKKKQQTPIKSGFQESFFLDRKEVLFPFKEQKDICGLTSINTGTKQNVGTQRDRSPSLVSEEQETDNCLNVSISPSCSPLEQRTASPIASFMPEGLSPSKRLKRDKSDKSLRENSFHNEYSLPPYLPPMAPSATRNSENSLARRVVPLSINKQRSNETNWLSDDEDVLTTLSVIPKMEGSDRSGVVAHTTQGENMSSPSLLKEFQPAYSTLQNQKQVQKRQNFTKERNQGHQNVSTAENTVFERLQRQGELLQQRREELRSQMRLQLEKESAQECTFQPCISSRRAGSGSNHARVLSSVKEGFFHAMLPTESFRQRSSSAPASRRIEESDEECTFKPKIQSVVNRRPSDYVPPMYLETVSRMRRATQERMTRPKAFDKLLREENNNLDIALLDAQKRQKITERNLNSLAKDNTQMGISTFSKSKVDEFGEKPVLTLPIDSFGNGRNTVNISLYK